MLGWIADSLSNKTARVIKNRLVTDTVTQTEAELATKLGDGYNVNTGNITFSDATEKGVLYIKNNDTRNLVVNKLFYILGTNTGGSGDCQITVVKSPTGGTLITGATDVDILENRNVGSSNELTGLCYKGTNATTLTGGRDFIGTVQNVAVGINVVDAGTIVLAKGTSIAIKMTPATGTTDQTVQFAAEVHYQQLAANVEVADL